MPSTPQFSRPGAGVMSSGFIRTRMTAALALACWQLGALVRSARRRRRPRRRPGSALTSWPISRSAGLIGVPATSLTTPHALASRPCARACRRAAGRGRAASRSAGRPSSASAPSSELRISGRRPMPDSSTPGLECGDGVLAVLVAGRGRVAHLDDLVRRSSACGPTGWRRCRCSSSARPRRDAERDVGGAEPADDRRGRRRS